MPDGSGVAYRAVLTMLDENGEVAGEPIRPSLIAEYGRHAQIQIGYDGPGPMDDMISVTLTPEPSESVE